MVPFESSASNEEQTYAMADWRVWPERSLLRRDSHEQHVEPKVMAVLCCLLREEGRVVGRDELLEAVWSDVVVNEEVLTRAVSELRTLLGDTGRPRRYIGTVPRKGYRMLVPVQQLPATAYPERIPLSPPAPPPSRQRPALRTPLGRLGFWLHSAIAAFGYMVVLLLLLSSCL